MTKTNRITDGKPTKGHKTEVWSLVLTPVSLWKVEMILQIVTKTCSLLFKTHTSLEDMHGKKEKGRPRQRKTAKISNTHRIRGAFNYLIKKNKCKPRKKKQGYTRTSLSVSPARLHQ